MSDGLVPVQVVEAGGSEKSLTFLRDVISSLETLQSPVARIGKRKKDRVDVLIEQYSIETFQGILCVFDRRGKIHEANERIHVLTDWTDELRGPREKEGNILTFVPIRYRAGIERQLQELHTRRLVQKKVEIPFPLSIGRYEISLPATLLLERENIMMAIEDDHIVASSEVELVRLKALIQLNNRSGLWVTDKEGIIQDVVGTNLEENLGFSERDVLGHHISEFVSLGDRKTVEESLKNGINEGYSLYRMAREGQRVKTEVVEGDILLQDGEVRKIYIDQYPA